MRVLSVFLVLRNPCSVSFSSLGKIRLADVITVVSDISEVPKDSADILVSEWMGFMMLTEDVAGDFLEARDRLLKESGI